jgi:hypothetical protein
MGINQLRWMSAQSRVAAGKTMKKKRRMWIGLDHLHMREISSPGHSLDAATTVPLIECVDRPSVEFVLDSPIRPSSTACCPPPAPEKREQTRGGKRLSAHGRSAPVSWWRSIVPISSIFSSSRFSLRAKP